jgi:hypothetical protein
VQLISVFSGKAAKSAGLWNSRVSITAAGFKEIRHQQMGIFGDVEHHIRRLRRTCRPGNGLASGHAKIDPVIRPQIVGQIAPQLGELDSARSTAGAADDPGHSGSQVVDIDPFDRIARHTEIILIGLEGRAAHLLPQLAKIRRVVTVQADARIRRPHDPSPATSARWADGPWHRS